MKVKQMYKYLLLLVISLLVGCIKSTPPPAPLQPYMAPPAQPKSLNSRLIEGSSWSLVLPNQFKIESRTASGQFEMVATYREYETRALMYLEEFDGTLDDFVSLQIQDAYQNGLRIVKAESTFWLNGNAMYLEVSNEDGTKIARHWMAVRAKKAYSFGCIMPRPSSDIVIDLCKDIAHSAAWN